MERLSDVRRPEAAIITAPASALSTNKVLKNTYLLLAATLGFSALTAGAAMALNLPHPGLIITLVGYFGLLFAAHKIRQQRAGHPVRVRADRLHGLHARADHQRLPAVPAEWPQVVMNALWRHRHHFRRPVRLRHQERAQTSRSWAAS